VELGSAIVAAFSPTTANADRDGPLEPSMMRRVVSYMRANLRGDCALETLCALAGISKFHFARRFRAAAGQAPHQVLLSLRSTCLDKPTRPRRAVAQKARQARPANLCPMGVSEA
jgi:hypothetical protein